MAAVFNLIGAFLGTGVAETIGSNIVKVDLGIHGMTVVLAALLGAIAWNLITWRLGLPSSSSHALIGALAGAGIASSSTIEWSVILDKVVVPMVVSPLSGFVLGYLVMVAILWIVRHKAPAPTHRRFRIAQTVSAAAMSLGHGLQDAQKTMGVIVLALVAGGFHTGTSIPVWVKLCAALAISAGTYSGGWRIMRTLGRRIIHLDPARGFAAEAVSAVVLYVAALQFHAPVSTTHTISSAIMGVGATKRLSAVRWGVARSMVAAWVLTLPAAGLFAAALYFVLHLFL